MVERIGDVDSNGDDDCGDCIDVIDLAEPPTIGRSPSAADEGNLSQSSGDEADEDHDEETAKMLVECSAVDSKYRIDPVDMGCGNYGIIRRCCNVKSGKKYALKSIPKNKAVQKAMGVKNSMNPGAIEREAQLLKMVNHRHIIRLIDSYEDDQCLHLITEICDGGMMFDRIIAKDRKPYTERQAATLIKSILEAVAYLHDDCNIVHRDIKLENFLFVSRNFDDLTNIRLIDFGMSRTDPLDHPMTTSIGTAYYVAPEVLDKSYGKSCDLWSVGVVSYMILCGYYPFYGDNTTQIIKTVKKGRFDYPAAEWSKRNSGAKDFVSALLTVDVRQRPTAREAMEHPWLVKSLVPKKSFSQKVSGGVKKRMSSIFDKAGKTEY